MSHDDERRWARRSVAAAGIVLAVSVLSAAFRPTPCGGLSPRYPPIIAFELARSQADLDALFGAGASVCRDTLVRAMDVVGWLDLAVFMPAYGAFLATWFLSRRSVAKGLATAGVALSVGAVACDVAENVCLFGLTPDLDASSRWLSALPWATGAKWGALALAAVVEAALLVRGGALAKVGAALCLVAPAGTLAALADPPRFGPTLAGSIGVAWVVCIVSAIGRARRPSGFLGGPAEP